MAPRPKKLSPEAIEILSSMRIEGNLAYLTGGQLDRKLYVECNDALTSLGGRWNKKAKAHLFPDDPAAAIEQVTIDGEFSDEARDFEFFATPPEVAAKLLDCVDLEPGDLVLEPSCGDGALVGEILKKEPQVELHAYEVRDSAARKVFERFPGNNVIITCKDFMLLTPKPKFNFVIMNPPFGKQADIDHVLHAWRFLKPKGKLVSVMSAGVSFRSNKKTVEFREFVEEHGGTIEPLPEGAFKSSGTSVRTVIVEIPN